MIEIDKLEIQHHLDKNRAGAVSMVLPAAEAARNILTQPEHTLLFSVIALGCTAITANFIRKVLEIQNFSKSAGRQEPLS